MVVYFSHSHQFKNLKELIFLLQKYFKKLSCANYCILQV